MIILLKKKKSVEIALVSVVSHLSRVGSDLITVQCLTCIRSSRNESMKVLFLFVCFIFRHYIIFALDLCNGVKERFRGRFVLDLQSAST